MCQETPMVTFERDKLLEHIGKLVEKGLDLVAVSTAHGHSKGVGESIRLIRDVFPDLTIMAGNVTSAEGVSFLAEAGASQIKLGKDQAQFAQPVSLLE